MGRKLCYGCRGSINHRLHGDARGYLLALLVAESPTLDRIRASGGDVIQVSQLAAGHADARSHSLSTRVPSRAAASIALSSSGIRPASHR